jgi:hypothetical protein
MKEKFMISMYCNNIWCGWYNGGQLFDTAEQAEAMIPYVRSLQPHFDFKVVSCFP